MALTRPLVVPAWADAGDKAAPTNSEIEAGWPLTTIPPSRQRFNWAMHQMHNGVRYLTRRGLADWSSEEAYKVGDRCLAANGMTYRCLADHTNVVPGTDATKWERWAYSESELNARLALLNFLPYGAPVACPNGGPAADADQAKIHKSALGEYWMWLGDTWGVTWNRHGIYANNGASGVVSGPGSTNFIQYTSHRAGVISAHISARRLAAAVGNTIDCSIDLNGSIVVVDALVATVVGQGMVASCSIELPVVAGDVVRTASYANYSATGYLRSSVYFKN